MNKDEIIEKTKKYLFSCVADLLRRASGCRPCEWGTSSTTPTAGSFWIFSAAFSRSASVIATRKLRVRFQEQTSKLQHMSTLYANEPQVTAGGEARANHPRGGSKNRSSRTAAPRRMKPRCCSRRLYQMPGHYHFASRLQRPFVPGLELVGAVELAAHSRMWSRGFTISQTRTATGVRSD